MSAAIHVWAFYLGFALSVSVYRLWVQGGLNLWNKLLFAPVLIAFYALDIALNYTVFMVFGLPPQGCISISLRMKAYRDSGDGFRKVFASFLCEKFLNPIDPSGSHC
jgi:hypothetical protein